MKKHKIIIELLSAAEAVTGLDPHTQWPRLGEAERARDEAARDLERRRADLATHEARVLSTPAAVAAGTVRADALREAIVARDAAALLIASAESVLAKTRERVVAEGKIAAQAVDREFAKRVEMLQRDVAEVVPVLAAINEIAAALAATRGAGAHLVLDWPSSPMVMADRRQAMHASAPATVSLAWSGSK